MMGIPVFATGLCGFAALQVSLHMGEHFTWQLAALYLIGFVLSGLFMGSGLAMMRDGR